MLDKIVSRQIVNFETGHLSHYNAYSFFLKLKFTLVHKSLNNLELVLVQLSLVRKRSQLFAEFNFVNSSYYPYFFRTQDLSGEVVNSHS